MSAATLAARAAAAPRAARPRGAGAALAICVLLSLAVQATVLVAPLLTMHVFDGVLETPQTSHAVRCSPSAFLLALLLGGVLRQLRAALLARARGAGRAAAAAARADGLGARGAGGRHARPRARGLQDVAELRRLLGGTCWPTCSTCCPSRSALGFLWLLHPLFFAVGAGWRRC